MAVNKKEEIISLLIFDPASKNIGCLYLELFENGSFDAHSEKYMGDKLVEVKQEPEYWDHTYFMEQMNLLKYNFSKKRLKNIMEVREFLFDIPVPRVSLKTKILKKISEIKNEYFKY